MKQITNFLVSPCGRGHYKVTIEVNGQKYSEETANTKVIDDLDDDDEQIANNAKKTIIQSVCYEHDLGYVEMTTSNYVPASFWLRPNHDELIIDQGIIPHE